uniref:RING-type E3 ubiquitin transferase n=1 Tax=Chelonoidis abingdonii TaxID=106734 RepID=A0A8C0J1Q1_CHEAB
MGPGSVELLFTWEPWRPGVEHSHLEKKPSVSGIKALEDDLACPICSDSLEDPVLLNCGHNFCQACITRVWEGLEENFSCPKCGKRFQERHLLPNPLLGKMVERARQLGWGAEGSMCQRHQERLKLYCQEDQALICLVCVRSKEHRAHRVVHIEEAAQEYKVTGPNTGHLEQSSGAGRGSVGVEPRSPGSHSLEPVTEPRNHPSCALSTYPPVQELGLEPRKITDSFLTIVHNTPAPTPEIHPPASLSAPG